MAGPFRFLTSALGQYCRSSCPFEILAGSRLALGGWLARLTSRPRALRCGAGRHRMSTLVAFRLFDLAGLQSQSSRPPTGTPGDPGIIAESILHPARSSARRDPIAALGFTFPLGTPVQRTVG
jgi:hypothetical protein